MTCAYFTYFTGVAVDHAELYPRPGQMITAPDNVERIMAGAAAPVA